MAQTSNGLYGFFQPVCLLLCDHWLILTVFSALLTIIPPPIWSAYVLIVNRADIHLEAPKEDFGISGWFVIGHQLYNRFLHPDPNGRLNIKKRYAGLEEAWNGARAHGLTSPELKGEWAIAHPKVLAALATALITPPAKEVFTKASIGGIGTSLCWVCG